MIRKGGIGKWENRHMLGVFRCYLVPKLVYFCGMGPLDTDQIDGLMD